MSCCRFSGKAPPRTSTTFQVASAPAVARTYGLIPPPHLARARGQADFPAKPAAMLQDALIDLTNQGDIVLDPFLGAGATLIAAENSGRVCYGVERDPLWVDVIIRRYEAATQTAAVLAATGQPVAKLALRNDGAARLLDRAPFCNFSVQPMSASLRSRRRKLGSFRQKAGAKVLVAELRPRSERARPTRRRRCN